MNTCDICGKIKQEGEKCGCELVKVIRIDYPDDGYGVFTYLEGYKYPYKGWADERYVAKNEICKRVLMAGTRYFWFILIFKNKIIDFLDELFFISYKGLGSPQCIYPNYKRFCRSSRELLRVLLVFSGENKKLQNISYGLTMQIEFDNAYRYYFQDIISLIDKSKPTRKELLRVIKIGIERCKLPYVKGKWELAYKLVYWVLLIPTIRNKFQELINELNIEEIKPDKGDIYFMNERLDHDYMGLDYKTRLAERVKEDKEYYGDKYGKPEIQEIKPAIFMMPNEGFWKLGKEEAAKMVNDAGTNILMTHLSKQ